MKHKKSFWIKKSIYIKFSELPDLNLIIFETQKFTLTKVFWVKHFQGSKFSASTFVKLFGEDKPKVVILLF